MPKSILLVGMMGSGKSFIGRKLAKALNVPFCDSDAEIEAAAGQSIPDIFAHYGEEEFRRLESLVIPDRLKAQICVLSTGGGAVINQAVQDVMQGDVISIWLQASIDTILERTRGSSRPLLTCENPREKIEELLAERIPLYKQAQFHVSTDSNQPDQIVNEIVDKLKSYDR